MLHATTDSRVGFWKMLQILLNLWNFQWTQITTSPSASDFISFLISAVYKKVTTKKKKKKAKIKKIIIYRHLNLSSRAW